MYHGEEFEKNVIERGYFALVKHVNRVLRIRVWHGISSADSSRREWVKRSSPSSVAGF
jgi:ATP-binding cassette subfamily D (ALD) long-chain fatty acid import protein